MANWTTNTIQEVVESIRDDKLVLPVIQRRLVWDEDKMALLFDTIIKGLSFGGIIVIKEAKGTRPLFESRQFSLHGEVLQSQRCEILGRERFFVIDGQQRLQSLVIGFHGSLNGKTMFWDITGVEGFIFAKDASELAVSSKGENGNVHESCWINVSSLVKEIRDKQNPFDIAEMYCEMYPAARSNSKAVHRSMEMFHREFFINKAIAISEIELPKSTESVAKNKELVVELFRRLNDGGTRLSSFDLVASILKSFSYKMEGFLEALVNKHKNIGLTQDNLIKLLFILEDSPGKEMTDIQAMDADFAIQNQERIENVLAVVEDFLDKTQLRLFFDKFRPSFIPLYFIAYHVFHSTAKTDELLRFFDRHETASSDFILMRNWVFHSFLNDVFRSKGSGWIPYRTGIRKMHECIARFKGKNFPMEELFSVYRNHPLPQFSTIYDIKRLSSLNSAFIFFLVYGNQLGARTNDVDHIMPRIELEGRKYDPSKINSICNYQLLDYGTNRGDKNGTPLSEWLSGKVENKETYLAIHKIPNNPALWQEDNFDSFYEERGKLLLECIRKATAV